MPGLPVAPVQGNFARQHGRKAAWLWMMYSTAVQTASAGR